MVSIKNILLVDEHTLIRDGIKSLLKNQISYRVVAEADSAEKALDVLKKVEVDLLIMDISESTMDGIIYIKQITNQYRNTHCLILTTLDEAGHIRNFIQAGVKGYILKSSGKEELLKAIEATIHGENYFSEVVSRIIMMDLVNTTQLKGSQKNQVPLTDRELDILELIVKEYTNQEIADKLIISIRTVDAHRRNLLDKIGARNTAGIVKYAIENKLLKSVFFKTKFHSHIIL